MKVNLDGESVLVDTTLTAEEVQNLLESTGRLAVLKGMGSTTQRDLGAAVAMVEGVNCIQGVVRFIQLSLEKCIIEGTIDGLNPGLHGLHVHTFGDLTDSFNKCGDHFNPEGKSHGDPKDSDRHMGDLGNILADETGRAVFRKEDNYLKVGDIIGRSIVVDEGEDDLGRGGNPLSKISGNSGERLAGGIIACSAGLFQNSKKICTCDGVTLWDERERARATSAKRQLLPQPLANL
ncbi:hypothetical protein NDU88_003804 [Pleurodeles waltl]|uniref:Superoxide dismutase copper/zinc binding domain-containing protein n=2 Tax=Pleurodeles waltl TaxID=8319 RepID=A0AAV7MRS2_PLEWA|nr:hypothetical protein NDU88_003804 [Pleurodeles waltl]